MSHLPKHITPRPLYIPARPLDFTYCSALTMSWTLIVLTICCSLGLFPVVTPHEWIVLFICPYETSSLFQTRPLTVFVLLSSSLFLFFFSDTWGHHRRIPFFSCFFFIAEILANVVIFTWVSRCLSIHRNFSDSTGAVRPLFIFAFIIHPLYNNTVQIRHPIHFVL